MVDLRCQHDKLLTFEDPRPTAKDPILAAAAAAGAQEWLDSLNRAREMAASQRLANSYTGDDEFRDLPPSFAGPARAAGPNMEEDMAAAAAKLDAEPKSRKRFSKRQSKSGLTAVF